MAQDFYPFVENPKPTGDNVGEVRHPARIAVYDDAAAAPRVVVVEPQDVRPYLEEITLQVTQLAQAQGGSIPFMVIREIVENFIHAYFMEPTISILDGGDTIRFSDQGPGIPEKDRALQYGTTSATEDMRRYIRGVGSGLPYAQQYMADKGGELTIEDNIAGGTVVTLCAKRGEAPQRAYLPYAAEGVAPAAAGQQPWPQGTAPYAQGGTSGPTAQGAGATQAGTAATQVGAPGGYGPPAQTWPQPAYPQAPDPQAAYPQQTWPQATYQQPAYSAAAYQQAPYPVPPYTPAPSSPAAAQQGVAGAGGPAWPQVSVRGRAILDYLATHPSVGPKDLAQAYGESQPTWTRELQALEALGLIRKDGQKRVLTAMGRSLLAGA